MLLDLAIQQFAIGKLARAEGSSRSSPRPRPQQHPGRDRLQPPGEETQVYSVEDSDLCLIGTAEITLGGMHADEVFDEAHLPIRTSASRTASGPRPAPPAGRAGDCTGSTSSPRSRCSPSRPPRPPARSTAEILALEEEIFTELGIPYRVLDICSGDLGGPAYRKFDLEAWMPGRGEAGEYGEVTSTSDCTDYQARRLNIRYKPTGQKGTRFVHTLNGTAVALSRALIVGPGELPAGRWAGRRAGGLGILVRT